MTFIILERLSVYMNGDTGSYQLCYKVARML